MLVYQRVHVTVEKYTPVRRQGFCRLHFYDRCSCEGNVVNCKRNPRRTRIPRCSAVTNEDGENQNQTCFAIMIKSHRIHETGITYMNWLIFTGIHVEYTIVPCMHHGIIICQVVVSNIFDYHPYLGKIPILTNVFQRG